jgi:hypothetical protein
MKTLKSRAPPKRTTALKLLTTDQSQKAKPVTIQNQIHFQSLKSWKPK